MTLADLPTLNAVLNSISTVFLLTGYAMVRQQRVQAHRACMLAAFGTSALFLISYVINIGFSKAWRKWPAFISGGIFVAIAGFGYLTKGTFETELLARAVWLWELYLFGHLGAAFIISGVIGTPGCEMRAFHDLYSRLTGIPTKEHYCPVGPLHPIDQWEARRSRG